MLKSKSNNQKQIYIKRLDENIESLKTSKIYNLSFLLNSNLPEVKKQEILKTIKKLILSTNFSPTWKSINGKLILIFLHIIFCIIGIIYIIFIHPDTSSSNSIRLLKGQGILIPFWLVAQIFYFGPLENIQKVIQNIGNSITQIENDINDYYNYKIDNTFSLSIYDKTTCIKTVNEIKDVLFSYIVTTSIEIDSESILYKEIIPQDDLVILKNVINFTHKELFQMFTKIFNKRIIPMFFFVAMVILFRNEMHVNKWRCIGLVILSLWIFYFMEKSLGAEYKKKFYIYISEYNKSLIPKGKFIIEYKTLLLIVNLNQKGTLLPEKILRNYMNKYILQLKD